MGMDTCMKKAVIQNTQLGKMVAGGGNLGPARNTTEIKTRQVGNIRGKYTRTYGPTQKHTRMMMYITIIVSNSNAMI